MVFVFPDIFEQKSSGGLDLLILATDLTIPGVPEFVYAVRFSIVSLWNIVLMYIKALLSLLVLLVREVVLWWTLKSLQGWCVLNHNIYLSANLSQVLVSTLLQSP